MANDEAPLSTQVEPESSVGADTPDPPRRKRRRTIALIVLAALPVLLTAAAQPFLPDIVSLHYSAGGVPDRWGPKAELFVPACICTVMELAFVGIYAVSEHQRRVGREDWLVLNCSPKHVFPVMLFANAFLAVMQAVILAASFWQSGPVMPNDLVRLSVDVIFTAIVLPLLGLGVYMVVTGKGIHLLNSHPGTSELERRIGADKSQSRALGGFLLFVTAFLIFEWIVVR